MHSKAAILKLWARVQQIAEQRPGLVFSLFVLNFFPIVWQNIHMYRWDQLGVLFVDAVFLLAGVMVFVLIVELLPYVWLRRLLAHTALMVSLLLSLLEWFSIYQYQTLVGAGIVTAVLQTNVHEAGEFLRMYVGIRGVVVFLTIMAVFWLLWCFLNRQRLSVPSRHKRSRILPVFLLAGAGAGLCLLHSYHSFIVNDSLDIPAVRMTRSADTAIRNIRAFEELREEAADDATIIENGSTVPYVVFILGESTNRDRLHLYGYPLENTPNLDELNEKGELAVYRDVISPQSATVAVLRELFTFHDVESDREWYQCNNLIDVMKAAGYRTYWLSNQESSGIWGNVAVMSASIRSFESLTKTADVWMRSCFLWWNKRCSIQRKKTFMSCTSWGGMAYIICGFLICLRNSQRTMFLRRRMFCRRRSGWKSPSMRMRCFTMTLWSAR